MRDEPIGWQVLALADRPSRVKLPDDGGRAATAAPRRARRVATAHRPRAAPSPPRGRRPRRPARRSHRLPTAHLARPPGCVRRGECDRHGCPRSRSRGSRWTRIVGVIWIAGGVAVLIWLGRSLELLPPTLAVLLILGGVASLAGVASGSAGERALALAWAATQVIFGVLSLTWPDVTLLVVAVVFGIRTIVWGVTLVTRSIRALFAGAHEAEAVAPRRARVLEAARWALAALLVVTCIGGWALNDWLAGGSRRRRVLRRPGRCAERPWRADPQRGVPRTGAEGR